MSIVDLAQLVIALATFLAVLVAAYQSRVNSKQLKAQYFNFIISYLQDPLVRDARRYVSTNLKDKELKYWTEEEKEKASIACGAFGTVGVYLEKGLISKEDIDSYKINIEDCYRNSEEYIDSRKDGNREYWSHFKYLFDIVSNNGATK